MKIPYASSLIVVNRLKISYVLSVVLLLCNYSTYSFATERTSLTIIEGIPFRLSIDGGGVTAVFEGEQGRPAPFEARRYVRASPIDKSIRSLTFYFDGDPRGYPLELDSDQSSSNSYGPLNVFALKGFVILPQQKQSKHSLIALENLKLYLLGEQADPDKKIVGLGNQLTTDSDSENIQSAHYTLELYVDGVTIVFRGSAMGGYPLEVGTAALSFVFSNNLDEGEIEFRPKEAVYGSDWEFDVISPDGRHVLLIQGHYGPYHVVSVDRLRGYLFGILEPDYEVNWYFPDSTASTVLSDGGWLSTHLIVFNATCCGTTERLIYELGNSQGAVLYSVDN